MLILLEYYWLIKILMLMPFIYIWTRTRKWNFIYSKKRTPLFLAAKKENIEIIKLFISHTNIDINAQNIHKQKIINFKNIYYNVNSLFLSTNSNFGKLHPGKHRFRELKNKLTNSIKYNLLFFYIITNKRISHVSKNYPMIKIKIFHWKIFGKLDDLFLRLW